MRNKKESIYLTLTSLSKELINQGHQVVIIANGNNDLPRINIEERVTIVRPPKIFSFCRIMRIIIIGPFIRVLQKKQKRKYQIINNFSSAPILVLRAVFAKLFLPNIKIIQSIKSYSKMNLGNHFFHLLNFANLVTIPTKVFAKKLVRKGVKEEKIEVMRSTINTNKFYPKNGDKLKQEYGYNNKNVIFYYGALWKEKGVKYLVEAIPEIKKVEPQTMFIFAPRERKEFLYQHKKLLNKIKKIPDTTILINKIKIEDYVNMAQILVLPYASIIGTEGNPSCLLEAMACKTAVVTSNLPELKEIVQHEQDVLLAEPENPASIAKNVIRLLNDKQLQERLTENAYKKSKQFDVRIIAQQYLKLYQNVLNKK
jgi:glycosyltransferase involved in cell wall biosynthesis